MVGAFLKCIFIYLTSQQFTGFSVEGTDIVWQMCLGRCVHLGLTNASFADQSHYCKSINAKQVHFGHNEEQTLATKLLACRLQKLDGESYWIRRHSIQNHNKPICHTMTFSGNTVHFSQNTPCSSLSHPFCETDKSSCRTSRSITGTVATQPYTSHLTAPTKTVSPTPQRAATPTVKTQVGKTQQQQQAMKPDARSSGPQSKTVYKLAVSKTSEPEWLKVGRKEYLVNYISTAYRQNGNISTNYFKILANPTSQSNSFWIGAHTMQDEEPSDTGITYIPYKNEPVRFSLTKEQVQGMWKELRQQRNANKNIRKNSQRN